MRFTANLLISLMINFLLGRTHGGARFTVFPPSVSYVPEGETAKLVWDYSVDNRIEEFDVSSPIWNFYAVNGSAFLIAQERVFNNSKWYINSDTCPARLLNPVRVSKESTATLVIHNVTLADSGTYGCVLVQTTRSPITSKVKLIVTSFPRITINASSSNIHINETQELFISCSAVGTPLPNVTWLRLLDGGKPLKNEGVGNVTFNIPNITRNDSGIYKCCATNNPNKSPVCKGTLVSVQYKPEIYVVQSNNTVSSYNGGTIRLYCLARGVPSPLFTWYDPRNRSITTEARNVTGGSLLTINPDRYGLYRCKAENILGYDEHYINVTQTAEVKEQQEENETPSFPVEAEENDMPIYAKVDLSKKKRNRKQKDIPIYAQIDKSQIKRPGQIIYAELDDMHSAEVIQSAISQSLPDRDAYGEIDFIQNTSHADNADPIYEAIPLE